MAIIKCIECQHDVSSYADKCPNCGCPISVIMKHNVSQEEKYDVVLENPGENKLQVIRFIRELSHPMKGLNEALGIVDNAPCTIIHSVSEKEGNLVISKLLEIGCVSSLVASSGQTEGVSATRLSDIESTFLFTKDQPIKCPRCSSTAVTTTSRGYSLITGFLGSNKTVNRCGKCGHTWKP